jgi:phospholipase C
VSYIDPFFIFEPGPGNDDHPHADVRLGQTFLSDIVEAFTSSPCYQRGALVVTYDEWGGFWDHVPPPRVRDDRATDADPGGEDDFGQVGFRIPSSIVSPWTRGERVDHTTYEHASTVKFIADNWDLPYLTQRVRHTNSIERAFRRFRRFDPSPNWVPYQAPPILWTESLLEEAGVDPIAATEDREFKRAADMGWFDDLGIRIDHRFEDGFLRPSNITSMLQQVANLTIPTL